MCGSRERFSWTVQRDGTELSGELKIWIRRATFIDAYFFPDNGFQQRDLAVGRRMESASSIISHKSLERNAASKGPFLSTVALRKIRVANKDRMKERVLLGKNRQAK